VKNKVVSSLDTHTHTHTHTCVCVCVCVPVYIYLYIYIYTYITGILERGFVKNKVVSSLGSPPLCGVNIKV
jgi:hypothetical protein